MNCKYLAIAALLWAFSSLRAIRQSGIEAQKSDYSAAVAIWRPLAENGDADAAFQPRPGLSPRPRRAAKSRRGTELVRARPARHVDAGAELWGCCCSRTATRPAECAGPRGPRKKACAYAMLVYGTALFNGDAVLAGFRYSATPMSAAPPRRARPGPETFWRKWTRSCRSRTARKAWFSRSPKVKAQAAGKTEASLLPPSLRPPSRPSPSKPPKPVQTASVSKPKPAPATVTLRKSGEGRGGCSWAPFRNARSPKPCSAVSGNGALAGRRAFYVSAGAVTRLQVGPFSRASAQAACGALKGQACFPVAAK